MKDILGRHFVCGGILVNEAFYFRKCSYRFKLGKAFSIQRCKSKNNETFLGIFTLIL
jgi:hypothetical protein